MTPQKAFLPATLAVCSLIFSILPASASPDGVVVFNEGQDNPEGSGEDGEWIELWNSTREAIDIDPMDML